MSMYRRIVTLAVALSLLLVVLSWQAATGLAVTHALAGALIQTTPARIRIDAGGFVMGLGERELQAALQLCLLGLPAGSSCDASLFADARAPHDVQLRTYFIDRTEVSQRAYLRCVAAGACLPSPASDADSRIAYPEQPVVQVTFAEAASYCRFVGGRLPTEAQWERAARGGSHRIFPWGDAYNSRLANHGAVDGNESVEDGYRFAAPVDAFPDGRSFYGALNMAGNVWELVLDRYAGPYDNHATAVDPTGASAGSEHVLRGGSWHSPPITLRTTCRAHLAEAERRPDVGFRCVYAGPAPVPQHVSPPENADAGLASP